MALAVRSLVPTALTGATTTVIVLNLLARRMVKGMKCFWPAEDTSVIRAEAVSDEDVGTKVPQRGLGGPSSRNRDR